MQDELIVLESMAACEGFMDSIKSEVNYLFTGKRPEGYYEAQQEKAWQKKQKWQDRKNKIADKFSNVKYITEEEFNIKYKKQYEYGIKAINAILPKLKKDPKYKVVAKAFSPTKYYDGNTWEDEFTTSVYYQGSKQGKCISLAVLDRDLWDCGPARSLSDDPHFIEALNNIYDEFSKVVGPGTKAPDLSIDDGGDWDTGNIDLIVKNVAFATNQ